jgi:hypothetical protein
MKWHVVPITIREARELLAQWHRRRPKCHAARFAVAVAAGGTIRAVALCGNPVAVLAENLDGDVLEVLRAATDGTPNACSRLQAAVDRVARAMGYRMLVTYTDPDEGGSSLRASGWRGPTQTKGGDRSNRPGRRSGAQPKRWRWNRFVA